MNLAVPEAAWRQIYPNAPGDIPAIFADQQKVLADFGVLRSRTDLAYFCAHIEHECGGFAIRGLTENINYTATRMAQVWPNRFVSAAAVRARYGTAAGWQHRAFDEIYGGRMGNRPGTNDGSTYIGRAGPQVTGRDGYRAVGALAKVNLENKPGEACDHALQPRICGAFWRWKDMGRFAERGDFLGSTKAWNGGTNGLADRRAQMAGNEPIIMRLNMLIEIADVVDEIEVKDQPGVRLPIVRDTAWVQDSINKVMRLNMPLLVDGNYGPMTFTAVKNFQKARGLTVDGLAGPVTKKALQSELSLN